MSELNVTASHPERRAGLFSSLPQAGLVLVSLLVIVLSLANIAKHSVVDIPSDQWEAATVSVAGRVASGEPMYSSMMEADGLEPGLYSPLQPLVVAYAFKLFGPSLYPLRIFNLTAGVVFVGLLLRAFRLSRKGARSRDGGKLRNHKQT